MSRLGTVVRAGVARRRLQSLVMALTTMMSVTAALLGSGLLVSSHAAFDQGFARQHGAHLTVSYDPAEVDAAGLAATARVPGVTALAGPFPSAALPSQAGANGVGLPVGTANPPLQFVGRTDPGGPVDDLTLTAGHWATGPGQVVLGQSTPFGVGDQLRFPNLPGSPVLTVVGVAQSAAQSADAWVSPQQLAALTPPGTPTTEQVLYRFARAADDGQLTADRAALTAAVPPGALTGAASYLKVKRADDKSTQTYVPFVIAFAVLGLAMSVLVIGIVVSGAVTAATRRIGILKAVGCSPAQVVRAYLGQALIPAGVGTVLGVLLGNLAAVPVLAKAGEAFRNSGGQLIAPWLDVVVPLGMLAAVAATAA
ncbi:ABC transporter permease, partial [Kitasatospora sp. LaBMicrA B282]|uniref:ABC transporter permease n=1 Tax=Kitasatospora sp. LaBMicrA B282 TaxID=3420949 RepID=UPI003D1327CA